MVLSQEEHDLLIEIRTKIFAMHDAMTTGDGSMRCGIHEEKLVGLSKTVDSTNKWVKGIVTSLLVGGFMTVVGIVVTQALK